MAELLRSGKKLEQLRVAELKEELDKRGLSKSGIKLELVKRLRQVSNVTFQLPSFYLCLSLRVVPLFRRCLKKQKL